MACGAAVINFWVGLRPHKFISLRAVLLQVGGTAVVLMLEPG